jgi:hypothetical protein
MVGIHAVQTWKSLFQTVKGMVSHRDVRPMKVSEEDVLKGGPSKASR